MSASDRVVLGSVDVINLVTNVPVGKLLDIIKNKLIAVNVLPLLRSELLILLDLRLKQNFCVLNKKLWCQEYGLAMGSPLSHLLADIYGPFRKQYFER